MTEEQQQFDTCPDCGLQVDLKAHGVCRLSKQQETVKAGVTGAFFAGVVRGFRKGKGSPPNDNRCRARVGDGYQCVLAHKHEGPHMKPPPIPNFSDRVKMEGQ